MSSLLLDLRTLPLPGLLKGYLWRANVRFLVEPECGRPSSQVVYERIKGISRSYQYLMIEEDDVLGCGSTGTASPPRSTRGAGAGGFCRRCHRPVPAL